MITIKVKRNENINRVLSKFKGAVMAEGTMKTVKDKSHFPGPFRSGNFLHWSEDVLWWYEINEPFRTT